MDHWGGVMENKLLNSVLVILVSLVLFACQSDPVIKTFANKDLRSSQYAKLKAPTGILILEIDGKELEYASEYHILPGEHKLHVMVSAFKGENAYKVGDIDISFYATAEHVYHILSLATSELRHKDYTKKTNEYLWIEDKTLDSVVAGSKP